MKKKHNHIPTDPSQIVTGSGSSKPQLYVPTRFRLPILLGLFIVLIGASAWYFTSARSSNKTIVAPVRKPPTVSEQADAAAFNGNYKVGQSLLDVAIGKTANKAEKAKLYEDKSLIAYNHKQYNDALVAARQAEELYPTRGSAISVATSAEALGDKKTAIEYYRKVLERTTKEARDLDAESYEYYENKLKVLAQ